MTGSKRAYRTAKEATLHQNYGTGHRMKGYRVKPDTLIIRNM